MTKIKTILFGLGTVNQGLLKILLEKKELLKDIYHLEFQIIGVADSSGLAISNAGFDYQKLIDLKKAKGKVTSLPECASGIAPEYITEYFHQADLLIESSPGNLQSGEPGLSVAREALRKGWPVVFANKAPLVLAFDELKELSNTYGADMRWSATVCGGLPVVNVLQRDLKLATLKRLRGILNATTNYILNVMEAGGSQEDALREAQRLGAAEADPTHDTHGHDAANKLFIIMKSFTDFSGRAEEISVEGIQNVTYEKLQSAKRSGNKLKLIAEAVRLDDRWQLSVKPAEVKAGSFLGTCNGWEMGIELETDLYESICLKNYEADPLGTSAAVLRDAMDVCGKGR
jgi:homoserine dehydrogenase